MIQKIVDETNEAIRQNGKLTKQVLAVGIEINQKYLDYLNDLLDSDLSVDNGVIVLVGGKAVRFDNHDDFSAWLAENMT